MNWYVYRRERQETMLGRLKKLFVTFADNAVPLQVGNREIIVAKASSVTVTIVCCAATAVLVLYPYYLMHGSIGAIELSVLMSFLVFAAFSLYWFKIAGDTSQTIALFCYPSVISFTVWGYFAGGIYSPLLIWNVTILGIMSFVDDRKIIIGAALLVVLSVIAMFVAEVMAWVPANMYSGEELPYLFFLSAATAVIYWTFLVLDRLISRQVYERKLVDMAKAAEAASRAKSEFLSTMSHEMRTPLNAVTGMSEVLLLTNLDDRQCRAAEHIKEAGSELLSRVENMLEISYFDSGRGQLNCNNFAIEDLVRGAVEVIQAEIEAKDLQLSIEISDDLANFYSADTDRLSRVIKSLLDNAMKFTEQGTITVKIWPREKRPDHHIVAFEFIDTGLGVAPDRQSIIFKAFTQADSSLTREHEGAGLGLAVSQLIVNAMGSEIIVESELGVGSKFHFDLVLPVKDTLPNA